MHRTTLALSLAVLAAAPSTALAGADYRASLATEDIGEALAAFKDKRPPVFKGR